MKNRALAALVAMLILGTTLAATSTAGAQEERANPWFVDRFEPAGLGEILEVRENGRVAFQVPTGRIYGDETHDFFVITGGDLTNFCLGQPPRSHTLIGFREDGEFVMRTPAGGIDVATFVYPVDGINGIAFPITACEAWATDGTPLPTPIASGFSTLRINSNPEIPFWATGPSQADGFYRNGLTGTLTDAEGNLWDLSTAVRFTFTAADENPEDFVRHDVSLTPQDG